MVNRRTKRILKLTEKLINDIDWQSHYLLKNDNENFEEKREDIIGTIDKLQEILDPPKDITPIALELFS